MSDLSMKLGDFVSKYAVPAVTSLADDLKAGRPISELDRKVLASCGYDADELIEFYSHQNGPSN